MFMLFSRQFSIKTKNGYPEARVTGTVFIPIGKIIFFRTNPNLQDRTSTSVYNAIFKTGERGKSACASPPPPLNPASATVPYYFRGILARGKTRCAVCA